MFPTHYAPAIALFRSALEGLYYSGWGSTATVTAQRFTPEVYRDFSRLQRIVLVTLGRMIASTKGTMLTFNAKKLASEAGLPTHPVVLTLIKEVIEQLREQGLVRRLSRTAHGVKYAVSRESPIWTLAKLGELEGDLEALSAKIKPLTYRGV